MSTPTGSTIPEAPCASVAHLHARFEAILPRIETHAQIRFRHLRCPGRREDAIQETIAVAWKWYLRLSEKGKDASEFVLTLADLAVRHVRSGRRLCGQERSKDVFTSRAQQKHGFRVERLPHSTSRSRESLYGDPHGQDGIDAFEERLRDNTVTPPDEQAAFRIDYPAWLSQLGERDRAIAQDMTLDLPTKELASRHKVSPGGVPVASVVPTLIPPGTSFGGIPPAGSASSGASCTPTGCTSTANPSPAESPTSSV